MPRFFVQGRQIKEDRVFLEGEDVHHLARVLRKRPGEEIDVVGPDGVEYRVRLQDMDPSAGRIEARILRRRRPDVEPAVRVTLAQALIRQAKMDHVIEKATELGVFRILPFVSARSVVRLGEGKSRQRVERWQRVAEAASKQSGRVRVPVVEPPLPLAALCERVNDHRRRWGEGSALLAWEGETRRGLFEAVAERAGNPQAGRHRRGPASEWLLITGPEGGFDQAEALTLVEAGAVAVSLGPLILRAETAGPSVLAMILYHVGDLGRGSAR